MPVMAPSFNMREIAKQLAMLEDHLNHASKRCRDCVAKHFLTIEGLAEECATLCSGDDGKTRALAGRVASSARVLHHAWAATPPSRVPRMAPVIAANLRQLRKELMRGYAVLDVSKLPDHERLAVRALTSSVSKMASRSRTASRRTHRSTASSAGRRAARAR